MLVKIKSNKVVDFNRNFVRECESDDNYKYNLDVDYVDNERLDVIDTYFTDITGGTVERDRFLKTIGNCFKPANQVIVLYGPHNSGENICIDTIENIFGSLCIEQPTAFYCNDTLRIDLDLYCFKGHKVFIVRNFNKWENLDTKFIGSIMNKDKMTCKKFKGEAEEITPECTIIFTSDTNPMDKITDKSIIDNIHTINLCGVFDRTEDRNNRGVKPVLTMTDEVFSYFIKYILSNSQNLTRRASRSAKLAKTFSTMLSPSAI